MLNIYIYLRIINCKNEKKNTINNNNNINY